MTEIVKSYPYQTREADCLDCPSSWNSVNAMGIALKHARAYGHTVEGHSATGFRYAPRFVELQEDCDVLDEDEHGFLPEERD